MVWASACCKTLTGTSKSLSHARACRNPKHMSPMLELSFVDPSTQTFTHAYFLCLSCEFPSINSSLVQRKMILTPTGQQQPTQKPPQDQNHPFSSISLTDISPQIETYRLEQEHRGGHHVIVLQQEQIPFPNI